MAKRGDIARQRVIDTIINAFSTSKDYICTKDKKIFVQTRDGDNGELIQFSIAITMPKSTTEGIKISSPTEVPQDKIKELRELLGI